MPIPYTLEELRAATHELIAANELRECYIRPIVFRGYGQMGLYPLDCAGRGVDRGVAVGRLPRRGGQAHGVRAKVSSWRRISARLADPARQGVRASTSTACWPRSRRRRPATRRRSCSTRRASSARARARTSTWCATARSSRRRRPPGSSTGSAASRSIQIAARPRLRGRRARPRAGRAVPRRRGVPVRHRRRARPGAGDRRPRDRRR